MVDLSFLNTEDNPNPNPNPNPTPNPNPNNGGIDLSFMASDPLTATQQAQQIVADQDAGKFPQGSRVDRAWYEKAGDVITGNDRETTQSQQLPELGIDGIGLKDFLGEKASTKLAATMVFTPNPVENIQMLDNALDGKLQVRADEAGNIIVNNPENGATAMLNKPGFTWSDFSNVVGLGVAYAPAGKLASGAKTLWDGFTKMALGSGAIQTGIEATQLSEGGNFDTMDIGISAGFGGASQVLVQALAKRLPILRQQISNNGITDKIRTEFKEAAADVGLNADDITDDVIVQALKQAQQSTRPSQQLAIAGEREFDIPLTSGQRSLDDAALSTEDRLRSGIMGEKSQRTMRDFETEEQIPAIDRAAQQVKTQLGEVDGSPGGVVRDGILTAERTAAGAVDDAYDQVGKAELSVEGMKGLFRHVKNSVRGVEFDQTLPQTKTLLDNASKFQKLIKGMEGKGLRPLDIKRIEQMRKRMNTAVNAADNPADRAQVMAMKNAFDDYLDTAMQKALFSGDDASLEALKNARGLFAEYAKKFRPQPIRGKSGRVVDRDEPGQFVEKIISANPTDEQIVNAVFGASNLNKPAGVQMARRFKEILGADSEGFKAVRTAAVKRLIKTNKINGKDIISGQQTLKAIDDALEKNGTLLKELFTKEEIGLLRRFAAQVKRTQPDIVKSRENPSGTAQVLSKAASNIMKFGDLSLLVTAKGIEATKGFRNSAKASNAVRPFQEIKRVKSPVVVGGTIAPQLDD